MNKRYFLLAFVLLFTITGALLIYKSGKIPGQSKVLMGYIQDHRDPDMIDYENLTHIIFSFAHPTSDGGVLFRGNQALTNLRTITENAQKHDTKVMLAVGGWSHMYGGFSYDYFQPAIENSKSRSKLVKELTRLTVEENLDGIDIDFEHPKTAEDAKNLAAFTKELSDKLHAKDKQLSMAVHSKIIGETLTEAHYVMYETSMFKDIDYVNIMAYDGHYDGGYNAANLSPYSYSEKVVSYWENLFEEENLPVGKLVLGVPSYAQPENPENQQVSYDTIIKNNPDNAKRDSVELNGTVYHYNGNSTIQKKTKLALEHGFGGMMIWEIGQDAKGPNSLTASMMNELDI